MHIKLDRLYGETGQQQGLQAHNPDDNNEIISNTLVRKYLAKLMKK